MILDSHTHFGNTPRFHCALPLLIESMRMAGIDKAIVSYLGGAEMDHPDVPHPAYTRIGQMGVLKRTVDAVASYPELLTGQMWIQPAREGYSVELEQALSENRAAIKGLKIHPYHSGLALSDERYPPYFEMAERLGLPVAVHTASDRYSLPRHVYARAKEFPNVDFIMVHMGLNTDHSEAIEMTGELPNLYGDTTWVDTAVVLETVKRNGSGKVLFGSDAPIAGPETYTSYNDMITAIVRELSPSDAEDVLWRNTARLFRL